MGAENILRLLRLFFVLLVVWLWSLLRPRETTRRASKTSGISWTDFRLVVWTELGEASSCIHDRQAPDLQAGVFQEALPPALGKAAGVSPGIRPQQLWEASY